MPRNSQQQIWQERNIDQQLREIVAMFSALRRAYDELPDKSGIDESQIAFGGFDANNDRENEFRQAAIRLGAVNIAYKAFSVNSHSQRLGGYHLILRAWNNSQDKENLTREDILRIINVE